MKTESPLLGEEDGGSQVPNFDLAEEADLPIPKSVPATPVTDLLLKSHSPTNTKSPERNSTPVPAVHSPIRLRTNIHPRGGSPMILWERTLIN